MKKFVEFLKLDYDEIAVSLSTAQPRWGEMNAHQMIEHLILVLQISNGKKSVPVENKGERLDKSRAFLFSDHPMPRNFKAKFVPHLPPVQQSDLANAIEELKAEIKVFKIHYAENNQATNSHPIFGDLNYEEWILLHNKHFDHHFDQFGLV